MITYDFCQRRDGQVFAVREDAPGGGVQPTITGAYGPLSEEQVDALTIHHLKDPAELDYDARPELATWLRDHRGQWGYSLHAPFTVPDIGTPPLTEPTSAQGAIMRLEETRTEGETQGQGRQA